MQRRVVRKQPNSRMCLVCGLENPLGLHASFYEVEGDLLVAVFHPRPQHQGYPERLHGGMAATILDETLGRSILVHHDGDLWGVTVDLEVRYRQPVSLDRPVRAVARIVHEERRQFRAVGRLLGDDGRTAVEARGRYLKMPLERIAEFNVEHENWRVVVRPDDPESFDLDD